jgi:NADPH:quinone reductase-like Zn-dependent oxidoreductase
MTSTRYDAVAGVREFEHLNDAVQAAKLKIPIAERYSLAEAHKAHLRLEAGEVFGKIVLKVHGA